MVWSSACVFYGILKVIIIIIIIIITFLHFNLDYLCSNTMKVYR